jgi:VanZ family protein
MLGGLFTPASRYRRAALVLAVLWTIGIFVACLWPGRELPQSDIPFVDKWTHFILFGAFSFLWLCAFPAGRTATFIWIILVSIVLGWLVECLQGWLPSLGRSKDDMDAVADGVGGMLGALLFGAGMRLSRKKYRPQNS